MPYTFREWEERLHQVCKAYPEHLSLFHAGESHDGRKIYEIRLGKRNNCLICAGGIHGREWVNPVLLLKIIEEYAGALDLGEKIAEYDIAKILERGSLCFVPMVNPDGYVIACEGFEQIRDPYLRYAAKQTGERFSEWKKNARGMDVNRNFPGRSWSAKNGPYPASEKETKALIQIFCAHPQSVGFLDFHSRGKLIYYYRRGMGRAYNRKSREFAKALAGLCGYRLGKPSEECLSKTDGGNSVHYYAEQFARPAVTVETLDENLVFPIGDEVLEEAYREIRLLPLAALDDLTIS